MNYIEFEIGGKKRGFRLGTGFLREILNYYDTDIQGLGRIMVTNPFSAIPAIVFYGHQYECRRNGEPVTFTMMDVDDWLDERGNINSDKDIQSLLEVLVDTIKKYLPEEVEKGAKGPKKQKKS